MKKYLLALLSIWLLFTIQVIAAPVIVSSLPALQTAIDRSSPGDTILLADGVYQATQNIVVIRSGAEGRPIVIAAQDPGKAEISGAGGFDLQSPASYIVISGFRFTHAASKARTYKIKTPSPLSTAVG